LIAPDETSGVMVSISATGHSSVLVASGIQHGGDIVVESAAFVSPGFSAGGAAYVADRATANNPHPGTDTILRLMAADLIQAGVSVDDLLVAAEGGGVLIDVRCAAACTSTTIVPTGTSAHIEGHLLMVVDQPQPTANPLPAVTHLGQTGAQLGLRVLLGILAVVAFLLIALRMRRSGLRRP